MAIELSIDATPQEFVVGSLYVSQSSNSRGTAAMVIQSMDGSYVPALDEQVLLEEDSTPVFGGIIDHVRVTNAGAVSSDAILTEINVVDFNVYADRRTISIQLAGGTLKSMLETLEAVVTPYGSSLDAGQVDGPTLPSLDYTIKTLAEVFNDLANRTAEFGEPFFWQFNASNVFGFYQPSTISAPFDLTTGPPYPQIIGDLVVETNRSSDYANNVTVYVPPVTEFEHVETFDGDGATDTFQLTYTLVATGGIVGVGYVTYVTNETLDYAGNGATWEYDPGTNTITRTTGAPASGTDNISITFTGTFTVVVSAQDAGEIAAVGQVDRVMIVDSIPSDTTAQGLADAYLAKFIQTPKTITYTTREAGLLPGQSQTVTVSNRDLSAVTATITDVVTTDALKGRVLERHVTAVIDDSQTNLGRTYQDVYRRWLGETTIPRSAAAVSTGGGSVSVEGSGDSDIYVYKSANEVVNSGGTGTTLQNDDHLLFAMAANSVYVVNITLLMRGPNITADFKFGLSLPASATALWGPSHGASGHWSGENEAVSPTQLYDQTETFNFGGAGATEFYGGEIKALVTTAGTAGNFQLQWAQRAADAGDSTIYAGSHLHYRLLD